MHCKYFLGCFITNGHKASKNCFVCIRIKRQTKTFTQYQDFCRINEVFVSHGKRDVNAFQQRFNEAEKKFLSRSNSDLQMHIQPHAMKWPKVYWHISVFKLQDFVQIKVITDKFNQSRHLYSWLQSFLERYVV